MSSTRTVHWARIATATQRRLESAHTRRARSLSRNYGTKDEREKNMLARSIYALLVAALAIFATPPPSIAAESPCPAILDHKFANLMDEPVSLCRFGGKVLLIVNTASECGYTPRYDGLEKFSSGHRAGGSVVLGFQANAFD